MSPTVYSDRILRLNDNSSAFTGSLKTDREKHQNRRVNIFSIKSYGKLEQYAKGQMPDEKKRAAKWQMSDEKKASHKMTDAR